MPNWDERRGRPGPFRNDPFLNDQERDAWRREARGHLPERRSFDDGRYGERGALRRQSPEMTERNRYAERGPREEPLGRERDAGSAGYRNALSGPRRDAQAFGDPTAYGGQEYGVEGHGRGQGGGRSERGFGFDRSAARSRSFDHDDPGVGQGAAGYAPQARTDDHEHDPDYLHWREEQLRNHDRDYAEWRRHQHEQYDEQYRQFRTERREHFGRAFHDWRSQRSPSTGVPDMGIAPGVGDYGDKTGFPGGSNVSFGNQRGSGRLEHPTQISADPTQSAEGAGSGAAQPSGGGSAEPEFGKEPPQVQASADGEVRRETDKDRKEEGRKDNSRH